MELVYSLASVLGALLIGAISPGPSFVLVARTSMAASRIDGLFSAIGMGIGGVVFFGRFSPRAPGRPRQRAVALSRA